MGRSKPRVGGHFHREEQKGSIIHTEKIPHTALVLLTVFSGLGVRNKQQSQACVSREYFACPESLLFCCSALWDIPVQISPQPDIWEVMWNERTYGVGFS